MSNSQSKTYTVRQLVEQGVLERPMDGNHGSYHPTAEDYVESGVPFIMASDLKDGRVDILNCKFLSPERASRLQKGFAKIGDVLLTHKATIGRTAIVDSVGVDGFLMLTPQVTYYRIKKPEVLDNRYLKYYFDSRNFQELLSQWAGAGSTRAYLGITGQLDLPIVVPPPKVQSIISKNIGSLDDKIKLNRKMNETLEQMARAIFKSWFIDFDPVRAKQQGKKPFGMDEATAALFPDSFEQSEFGEIPKGWRVGSLQNAAKVVGGFAFKSSDFTE